MAVVVRCMLGVRGVQPVAVRAVRAVAVRGGSAGRRVVLVRWVLNVCRWVVVMVMVVGWGILHLTKLRVVRVHLSLGLGYRDAIAGRVMQVGGMRRVRDQCRVGGVGRLLGRFAPFGAEKRSEERGGVGDGLLAGGAVAAGSASAPYVRAANDGPLHPRGHVRSC